MCGRYTLYTKKDALEERFHADMEDNFLPNYNATPSQRMPIITNAHPESIILGKWGFLPQWAKANEGIRMMNNARADGVATKPFFRDAFKKHRCLILADGFYEWNQGTTPKTPYRFVLKSGEPFAMAGIYSEIRDTDGSKIPFYAIITTDANKVMAPIHDRMPVILPPELEEKWLNTEQSPEELGSFLIPYKGKDLTAYEVDRAVNVTKNNSPALILPVPERSSRARTKNTEERGPGKQGQVQFID